MSLDSENIYWQVAVDAPLREALTYRAPADLSPMLKRGLFVRVPLGKRQASGVLLRSSSMAPDKFDAAKIKSILEIDSEYPALPESYLTWIEWLAQYYFYPVGQVAQLAIPPLRRAGARATRKGEIVRVPEFSAAHALNFEQQNAVDGILSHSGFHTHLLHGVTGSGKTEVYLSLFEKILDEKRQGIFLLPEISLTPQLISRFANRFARGGVNQETSPIAVLHSQLTDRERTNQWWDMIEGRKSILIGARSALFCPLQNLGLIVVDEEHEPSFKQDEKLKYNGRDAAIVLAKLANAPVVLGSATPSLESWHNATTNKYKLHTMKNRVADRALPSIEIVDMRAEKDQRKEEASPLYSKPQIGDLGESRPARPENLPSWMSQTLFEEIKKTLDRNEQVALFLNRRGMAPVVFCESCGYSADCPNCDISLTLHGHHHLVCHYCDFHQPYTEKCPSCADGELKPLGLGTELVEETCAKLFAPKIVARADRDEIQNRTELEELVTRMENGGIDILVGTQMIAKGLDFKKLKTVGLILADVGFNLPDFRSTERSFQLITQVSGRAGRHVKENEDPGKVIIQTYNTEHPSLTFAKQHDYVGFAALEMEFREMLSYPPVGKLAVLRIQGNQLKTVQNGSQLISHRAQALRKKSEHYAAIEVLGPAEAPLAKLRGQYRYHVLLKSLNAKYLNSFIQQLIGDEEWLPSGLKVSVDVDPLHLL